jgi:glycine/D-amino acid oxidase-like deaminating enzyme
MTSEVVKNGNPPPLPPQEPPRQHGVRGVYYGGEWMDIEECAKHCDPNIVNPQLNDCDTCISPCPRSRTRHTSAKQYVPSMNGQPSFEVYDIVIIGAGCIGATIARTLCQYEDLSMLWVEAADDVSQGATKGNSGIVHAGYDDTPGSVRSQHCWKGNQMFAQLDQELHFGYQKNGSLVLATNDDEVKELHQLHQRGLQNGVQNLQVITDRTKLRQMEPYIADNVIGALYAPDAGNVIPYEFAIALAENAVDNGVELRIRTKVTSIEQPPPPQTTTIRTKYPFTVHVEYWEPTAYVASISKQKVGTNIRQGLSFIASASIALSIVRVFAWHTGVVAGHLYNNQILNDMRFVVPCIVFVITALLALVPNPLTITSKPVSKSTPLTTLVEQAGGPVGGGSTVTTKSNGTVQHSTIVPVEDMFVGGSGSSNTWNGRTVKDPVVTSITQKFPNGDNVESNSHGEPLKPRSNHIRCSYVINCAGGASDQIAAMIGDTSFHIKPRLGDYILLNRNQVSFFFCRSCALYFCCFVYCFKKYLLTHCSN